MTSRDDRPEQAAALRRRAEEIAREKAAQSPEDLEVLSPEETRQTLHELRVHQIELEMQNEELRRAQVVLDAARARYFDLYDLAPVGYCTISEEGLILEANLTAATLLGAARSALVKQRVTRFILKEDQDLYYLHRRQLLETGKPQACELRMKKDETAFWARLEAAAAPDAAGAPVYRVVMSDITERKRAEAALRQKVEELARSNAELEQFAYVASHDLQEPLRTAGSFAQLLQKRYQGKLDQTADEFIGYIVDGTQHMQRLINDLLTFARVGTRGKAFEPADCAAVLAQAVAHLQIAIEEGGAVVTHDPLPVLNADPGQLGQLLQNLIGNSIKFHAAARPRIHVSAQRTEEGWVFSVQDNGIGIDPQFADRIFEVFQRLHTRAEYPGTGIGLAVCKKIVERHQGRIWVESAPGKGATFRFTIPS
jgi:PAS domain S-box-containing protein